MQIKLWHQTIAAEGRLTLFPDEQTVRTCVRTLGRIASNRLLLFSLVDDHLHQLSAGSRSSVGQLARGIALTIGHHVAPELAPTYTKVVDTRRYLRHLVDYFLQQAPHHDLAVHPALWGGSCFLDLVGARIVPGLTLRLGHWLPRLRLRDLLEAVGLPPHPQHPADDDTLRKLGAFRIASAAAAATCTGPTLAGRDRLTVLARATAATLAQQSGISRREIADALGTTARTMRRLLDHPPDVKLVRATRIRLSLEETVTTSAATPVPRVRFRGHNSLGVQTSPHLRPLSRT
jgi:hypothetical protein